MFQRMQSILSTCCRRAICFGGFLLFPGFFLLVGVLHADESWAQKKLLYEDRVTKAQTGYQMQMENLAEKYSAALERASEQLQSSGELEALMAVKTELRRFSENRFVPDAEDDRLQEKVKSLRGLYLKSSRKSKIARDKNIRELTLAYLAYLEGLQKSLTREGKLEDAMAVSGEKSRVKTSEHGVSLDEEPPASDGGEDGSTKEPAAQAGFEVMWWGTKPSFLQDQNATSLWRSDFTHSGENDIKSGALYCTGGRSLVSGMNEKLLAACKASNELSLVLHFQTDHLNQSGPARILSFSLDSDKRNFSLCQEGSRLVLRLRTTRTGLNGSGPSLYLGSFQAGKPQQVAVSYRDGKVICAINGKLVAVRPVEGDFSNWEPCQLLVGNEWKAHRPWGGRVFGFEIHSSAIDAADAVRRTKP